MRGLVALIGAAAAITAGALVGAPVGSPAVADPIGQCTTTRGAIVAVDFGHWSGPIVRGCGADSKTGYALLNDGGFSTAGTTHDGPSFICRLGNDAFHGGTQYPTPAQDKCVVTPPASAYWSYWLAPAGQNTWSYSQLGTMSDVPKPGEVELWRFGGTDIAGTQGRPTISPNALRAHNSSTVGGEPDPPPTKRSSSHHHVTPSSSAAKAAHQAATSHAGAPASTHTTLTRPTSKAPAAKAASNAVHSSRTATATGSASSSTGAAAAPSSSAADPTGSTPPIVDASPASAQQHKAAGSPVPLIGGGALLVLLGAGTGWTVWRRRHAGSVEG